MELQAIRNTFQNGIEAIATVEASGNLRDIEELGRAFSRSCSGGSDAPNVMAILVETCREAYVRARRNGPIRFTVAPVPAMVLNDGTYTLAYADGSHFTFRIRTATRGKFAGRRLVQYLSGPSNELDFQPFAFVNTNSINVWRRFERGTLVNRAQEIERMARNGRERARRRIRRGSTPESAKYPRERGGSGFRSESSLRNER